jgi:alkylhydroperoxidase/carboxymuconolactone decarboxylase family protein YurZ
MITEAAGGGIIRQDVQEAIQKEQKYRLGEGDAAGALSRWQKELLLLVINVVKGNVGLSQVNAMAAIKAGAKLEQVLSIILYVHLMGMVKFRMVGMEAYMAAEGIAPESQRLGLMKEATASQQEMVAKLKQSGRHLRSAPDQQLKLAEVAPGVLEGFLRMRENIVKPDPHGAVPRKLMELAIISADVVQMHPYGALRHLMWAMDNGATVPEVVEAVSLVVLECGVPSYKMGGLEVIEAAEKAG